LAGIVHGVVVQMTAAAGLGSLARPKAAASLSACASVTGKATSSVGESLSAYSTSASASAEPQSKHQFTGFKPLKT